MDITHSATEFLSMQPAPRDPFAVGPREHMNQLINIVAMSRNGDHRFLPVLMSKVTELLPRLINPMLQNPPENPNLANIDIFDGFGNAGMAQPPTQMQMTMDTDYDRKFSVEEYEKKYAMDMNGATPESQSNSNSSTCGQSSTQQSSDLNGSFNSPGIMSPGMEYPPSMNGFACTPMSDMVMSPMGHHGQSNTMGSQQMQHQSQQHMGSQQMSHGHDGMNQHHMNSVRSQGMGNPGMTSSHPINNICGIRQPPQRQNSFHLSGPPQMRTVGDFQGLQRAGSDARSTMVGMGSMGNEIDFGALQ